MRHFEICLLLAGTLLAACSRSAVVGEDRYVAVEPQRYRGQIPNVEHSKDPARYTGTVVGAVFDCDGRPLAHGYLVAYLSGAAPTDTLREQLDSATFSLDGLRPGSWQFVLRLIGYRSRQFGVEIEPGRIDTLLVRLSPSSLAWHDCLCADQRSFGRHCCRSITFHTCSTEAPCPSND